jgi:hypothetical protein
MTPSERSKLWKSQNPERYKENRKRSYKNIRTKYPLANAISQAKTRAKKLGLSFDLNKEDLKVPEVCPILGIRLLSGVGKLTANSPSLDRVDPAKGYVVTNVRVISHRANTIKSDMPIEVFEKIVEYMRGVN